MAKVTVIYETERLPIKEVTLILSPEEAQAVVDFLQQAGGHPKTSRRGLIDNVLNAFCEHKIYGECGGAKDIVNNRFQEWYAK